MRSRSEVTHWLVEPGIIAVVRVQRAEQILPLSRALVAGGVIAIEITMTTPSAIAVIERISTELENDAVVGVGTVLDEETCRQAIRAGAEFVVSPITNAGVLKEAHAADRPVMLGAYTPTEAQTVHELGADFVKLFPAEGLGPKYIKALRAPLPHLKIVPTGGVDLNTSADFIVAGCVALGVGSSLISAAILRDENWPELTRLGREFISIVQAARRTSKD